MTSTQPAWTSTWPASGEEMDALIRAHDWAASPLGPIEEWSDNLHRVTELMLAIPQPAFACWGEDLRLLYNDEYRALLGAKHPGALGRPFCEVFAELGGSLRPALRAVLAGEPQRWGADAEFSLAGRGDGLVPGWFAATWTPLRDDAGRVVGFFGLATETTGRVLAERALWTNEKRMRGQKEAFQAAINGAPLEDSLSILARMVAEETAGEARTAFYVADPDGTCMHPIRGAGDMPEAYTRQVDGFRVGNDSLACGLATATGRPVLTGDVLAEPLWKPWLYLAEAFDFRGCWSFPIATRDGETLGTFAMYFAAPREASQQDFPLADAVTQAAAIIIARHTEAQERARAEAALRASEERLRAIYDGTYEYIGLLSPDGTLLEANRASLEFGDSGRDDLVGRPFWETVWFLRTPGASEQVREAVARAAGGEFIRYEAPLQRSSGEVVVFDISLHPVRNAQGAVVLIVPEGRDITYLKRAEVALRDSEGRLATEREQLAVAQAVAAERQALLKRFVHAQEEERARVSRDIHDSVTQLAHAAAMHLDNALELLDGTPAPARAEVERGRDLARAAAGEARRLITGLRPETLDTLGLAGAIGQEVEALRMDGWEIEFRDADLTGVRLDPEAEITLFRVTQEALNNVRKHAGQAPVRVSLRRIEGSVRVEVRDWGRGFNPKAVRTSKRGERVGLVGMRERMALLGGSLQVRSGSELGTTVRATLPLAGPND